MFTKGEINLGYIFSTVIAVVVGGIVLHIIMKKQAPKNVSTVQKVEETTAA